MGYGLLDVLAVEEEIICRHHIAVDKLDMRISHMCLRISSSSTRMVAGFERQTGMPHLDAVPQSALGLIAEAPIAQERRDQRIQISTVFDGSNLDNQPLVGKKCGK